MTVGFYHSRSPGLAEVLQTALDYRISDLHTSMPGIVESYNEVTKRADIKPALKRSIIDINGHETVEDLPVIPNVPIMFQQAGGFFILFKIVKGTPVMLDFSERSLDRYLAGQGKVTDPVDLRTHDLSDAVAYLGCSPLSKCIKTIDNESLTLGADNNGAQIHIKDGGIIEITFAGGNVLKLTASGLATTATFGDGTMHVALAEPFMILWNAMLAAFMVHTHNIILPMPGTPTAVPNSPLSPWIPTITSTKIAVPNG